MRYVASRRMAYDGNLAGKQCSLTNRQNPRKIQHIVRDMKVTLIKYPRVVTTEMLYKAKQTT